MSEQYSISAKTWGEISDDELIMQITEIARNWLGERDRAVIQELISRYRRAKSNQKAAPNDLSR